MRLRIIFIFLIISCSMSVFAQKYKDLFPQIRGADSENSFELLNAFLMDNLDHPNANLRIALIYSDRFDKTDALRDYDKATALAEQAKMKLFKAKIVVTEKELKKNAEYYFGLVNAGSAPSFLEISALINEQEIKINEFLQKAPLIFSKFTKSVEKYDQAVKSFADIVGSYKSLKELYLLYDESLKGKLENLKSDYDSTKIYFDEYLNLRQGYEFNAVLQAYSEAPVNVYRLDGLVTQIDFLQPDISLWNYAAWVDSVNVVMEVTINKLRTDLYKNEEKLRKAVLEVEKVSSPETFNVVHVDKALIFNLLKYDYKNSIVPLLSYYEFKQQFIIDQNRQTYFDTAAITPDRKLAYYNDMLYKSKLGDSIIVEFESRFNPQQLVRHKDFVDKVFGNAEAMEDYMVNEKKENKKLFLKQVTNIKQEILAINANDSIAGIVKYRKTLIPLYIDTNELDQLPTGQVKTMYLLPSADESLYVVGLQINDKKYRNQEVVLAKFSSALKPLWVKNIDLEIDSAGVDANQWLGDAILTSDGVALVVRSEALDSSKVINTLLHYTAEGKLKNATPLATELYPRAINFIESANMFVLAFFGEENEMDVKNNSTLTVLSLNGLGQQIWQFDYPLSGNFIGMINTNKGLLISGNYTLIKNKAGRTFTKDSGTNAYIISLTSKGALVDINCLASETDYYINKLFKVNDNNINLLGTKGEQIIINDNLQEIYSSVVLK